MRAFRQVTTKASHEILVISRGYGKGKMGMSHNANLKGIHGASILGDWQLGLAAIATSTLVPPLGIR